MWARVVLKICRSRSIVTLVGRVHSGTERVYIKYNKYTKKFVLLLWFFDHLHFFAMLKVVIRHSFNHCIDFSRQLGVQFYVRELRLAACGDKDSRLWRQFDCWIY